MGGYVISVAVMMSCLLMDTSVSLRVGFYNKSCPNAEATVRGVVREAAIADQNNVPVLLRLHFHDCFVQIRRRKRMKSERSGTKVDVIERAKAQLEALCPRTVSCSDIVALAARDALLLAQGAWYEVETGRRDGLVSNVRLADDMPDVSDSIQTQS